MIITFEMTIRNEAHLCFSIFFQYDFMREFSPSINKNMRHFNLLYEHCVFAPDSVESTVHMSDWHIFFAFSDHLLHFQPFFLSLFKITKHFTPKVMIVFFYRFLFSFFHFQQQKGQTVHVMLRETIFRTSYNPNNNRKCTLLFEKSIICDYDHFHIIEFGNYIVGSN